MQPDRIPNLWHSGTEILAPYSDIIALLQAVSFSWAVDARAA